MKRVHFSWLASLLCVGFVWTNSLAAQGTGLPSTVVQPQSAETVPGQPPARMMERAILGVTIDARMESDRRGALIAEVAPNGPADKAGLTSGDLIVKVENQDVRNYENLTILLRKHKPGDKVKLTVKKGDQTKDVTVTLGTEPRRPFEGGMQRDRRPIPGGVPMQRPMLGIQMQPMTPDLKERLGVGTDQGVVVADVMPGSPAKQAGLRRDDIVITAEGRDIHQPEDLLGAIRQVGVGHDMNLTIMRAKEKKEIKIKLEPQRLEGMPPRMEGMMPPAGDLRQTIQRLESKIEQLEKRIVELEKKPK